MRGAAVAGAVLGDLVLFGRGVVGGSIESCLPPGSRAGHADAELVRRSAGLFRGGRRCRAACEEGKTRNERRVSSHQREGSVQEMAGDY